MWTFAEADIIEMWVDLEQYISEFIWQGQEHHQEDVTLGFYNEKHQLYTETDAWGVGLGTSLLQLRDGMQFPRNKTPDKSALQ